ncbi:MAG: hypothetical protein JXR58_05330 [Bacteroidales bacterium]|nr:hypothetical protein [Bacteroidales bacterium]
MKRNFLIFVVSILITSSCYYDNEKDLYPVSNFNNCDTSNIVFSTMVLPTINSKCNNCHSEVLAPELGGHISLENYENIKYSVDNGSLWGSINYFSGFSPMPPENRLDDCSILQIEIWIKNGAKND